jgi:hypothetical protein
MLEPGVLASRAGGCGSPHAKDISSKAVPRAAADAAGRPQLPG